ncbi:spartin-like isoform X2 [Argiope bruennichi]|uniref:Spartin like protein n=2 Tax=Argiope bruennichi TaxID=94029 RepID=A0A8T0F110_ARGBR|nr:spartin-like isoform X2 [Argiope bruennichi]KAF8782242.1 Spartin like protein [Argiope bruennichi]
MALSSSESSLSAEHQELIHQIQVNHDEAYLYISQGLSYQEQDQLDLARDMYTKGLEKIDKALSVRCDHEFCTGPKWEHARKLQEKMERTLRMVRSQLRGIPPSSPASPPYTPPEPFELPPSYDEACEHEVVTSQRRSSCPGSSELNGNAASNGRRMSSEVIDLFCIPGDVQIFFVSFDGSVSAPHSPSSLHVYQFVDQKSPIDIRPPAWLQVGSWTYPLVPGQSPALESGYGAFLFPNVGVGRDSAVGVILPSSVTPEQRTQFLEILNQLTALKGEKWSETTIPRAASPRPQDADKRRFSDTISKGLVTGAEYLSAGIIKGAQVSSDLIHKGATKARQKIQPELTPVTIDPRVKEGLKIAHEASGVALRATGYLVKKLGDLTFALGAQLAPHIREQGTKFLTSTFKSDPKEAKDTVDGVLTVAAGGVQSFSTIYSGLENAARILAKSLSTETVNIVGHKYGNEAGEVVGNAVYSIGNLALTTHNVQSLGVKAVAKRTAKDAGKAVLKDYAENVKK